MDNLLISSVSKDSILRQLFIYVKINDDHKGKTFNGAYLMKTCLECDIYSNYESKVIQLVKQ